MGTNDDNAGNIATLQATVETAIDNLRASNPRATIYYMNVLPRWTDVGGGTVVDKSSIRTAIAAACTAKAVTCWDTFTDPWITAAQTSDGLHPTAAGHAAIAAQVLARL
jgi:lysophospholipase L1-like esterase